ncbi:MAG TPA: 1-acyl-sn-glycerol-3-phosphate acyltransferase [Dehalococcoidia bacterium]|nr:1-acyl-sn-glycerol-3-phosphate acyltransferase [Dehalococcoidia bacterium]
MHWIYYGGRYFTRVVLFLFARWRVLGREHIPKEGPLLVAANHLSLADPPIMGLSINRQAMFLAKEELFRSRVSRYFVQNYGSFPIRRGGMNRDALRFAEQWFGRGRALIVFPEGRRSMEAQMVDAFSGPALIAVRNGVPILPVGISGTEKITGSTWWLRRPRITVNIGRPFHLPSVNGKVTKEQLAEFTGSIMAQIAELLPEKYRGQYGGEKS